MGPPVPPRTSAAHGRLGAASLPDGSLTLFLSALWLGSLHNAFLVSGGAGGRHVLSRGLRTESRREAAGPPAPALAPPRPSCWTRRWAPREEGDVPCSPGAFDDPLARDQPARSGPGEWEMHPGLFCCGNLAADTVRSGKSLRDRAAHTPKTTVLTKTTASSCPLGRAPPSLTGS